MLVKGDARARIRTPDVRGLPCSDHLKEIVYRCIGERRKRYESADELIEALRNPPASLKPGVLRSLKGVHLAFTGILPKRREERSRAARRAGAIVHSSPSLEDDGRRPRPAQPAAGGGPRRRAEADGDQAAAREGAPHHAARTSASSGASPHAVETMRVLIVEDDPTIADFVAGG